MGKQQAGQQVQTAHRSHGECFNHTQVFVSELGENRYKLEELYASATFILPPTPWPYCESLFSLFLSWVTTARSREDESLNGHWNATQNPNPN